MPLTGRSPAPVWMPWRAYGSLDNVDSHMELPSAMADTSTCQAVSFQAAGVLSRCTVQEAEVVRLAGPARPMSWLWLGATRH